MQVDDPESTATEDSSLTLVSDEVLVCSSCSFCLVIAEYSLLRLLLPLRFLWTLSAPNALINLAVSTVDIDVDDVESETSRSCAPLGLKLSES